MDMDTLDDAWPMDGDPKKYTLAAGAMYQNAGESGQGNAEAVSQGDHARHVDPEGPHQRRVLGGSAQISAEPRALDGDPGAEAYKE